MTRQKEVLEMEMEMELNLNTITAQARQAVLELLEAANLRAGDLFVVGCSSSEITGGQIGHASSLEAAQGTCEGYSHDPQGGRYRYSPSLDMTCFRLLIPALAEPVARSQLDEYRLMNLWWEYEEISYPGLDFVILATVKDETWQIAALGKGGRAAVFRYAGVERLEDHLETLAEMVI